MGKASIALISNITAYTKLHRFEELHEKTSQFVSNNTNTNQSYYIIKLFLHFVFIFSLHLGRHPYSRKSFPT